MVVSVLLFFLFLVVVVPEDNDVEKVDEEQGNLEMSDLWSGFTGTDDINGGGGRRPFSLNSDTGSSPDMQL